MTQVKFKVDWNHEGDMFRIKNTDANVEDGSYHYEVLALEYPDSVTPESEIEFWNGYYQLKETSND